MFICCIKLKTMKKIILLSTIGLLALVSTSNAQEMPKFKSDQEKTQWVNDNPESYKKALDVLKEDASKANSKEAVHLSPTIVEPKNERTESSSSTPKKANKPSPLNDPLAEDYNRKHNNLKE